jgi:acetyl-CoA carboxylase biotin carboxyl carrier protein
MFRVMTSTFTGFEPWLPAATGGSAMKSPMATAPARHAQIERGLDEADREIKTGAPFPSDAVRVRGRMLYTRRMADIEAHITGTVWKIEVAVGDDVEDGDTVVILESMKMEMPVESEDDGKVAEIRCEEGQSVQEGDVLVVLE